MLPELDVDEAIKAEKNWGLVDALAVAVILLIIIRATLKYLSVTRFHDCQNSIRSLHKAH